ncbi:MAG: iron-sulfur cluster assembly scaffold protein [Pseudomonadota bacterium]
MTAPELDSDNAARLYNTALLEHVSGLKNQDRLTDPAAFGHAVSPICGSEVTIDLTLNDTDGTITAIGHEVSACALTKTVLSVLRAAAPGMTRADIEAGHSTLRALLENGETPQAPWQDLDILRPARDYTARHNSMLLPFEASLKAFDKLANPPKNTI